MQYFSMAEKLGEGGRFDFLKSCLKQAQCPILTHNCLMENLNASERLLDYSNYRVQPYAIVYLFLGSTTPSTTIFLSETMLWTSFSINKTFLGLQLSSVSASGSALGSNITDSLMVRFSQHGPSESRGSLSRCCLPGNSGLSTNNSTRGSHQAACVGMGRDSSYFDSPECPLLLVNLLF